MTVGGNNGIINNAWKEAPASHGNFRRRSTSGTTEKFTPRTVAISAPSDREGERNEDTWGSYVLALEVIVHEKSICYKVLLYKHTRIFCEDIINYTPNEYLE